MKLEARTREPGDPRELRRSGRLPAIVYNKMLNVTVSVDLRAFDKAFRSTGTSHLIDLDVDGTVHPVLVRAVQMNKRTRLPQHIDFFVVTAGQKVTVNVPIELIGIPQGVKDGGQTDVQRREVAISILPRLIPERLEIDVSGLTIGDSLHVGDLVDLLPSEAEILDDLELAIVAVVPPRVAEEEPTTAEDESGDPEVIGEEREDDEGESESESESDED
ncbi:50S ribosomal protein L25 [soil metagenome]